MSFAIEPGGLATVLIGESDPAAQVAALARTPGFAGAAVLRAVGPFRKAIAYVRWSTEDGARFQGQEPLLRAVDVRRRTDPLDRGASVPLAHGSVALVLRWEVEASRCDALLAELQDFTDAYFPTSRGIRSTAFHVSDDRKMVSEYLQADSTWTMFRIQFNRSMRRHQRLVNRLVRATDVGLYRVADVTEAG